MTSIEKTILKIKRELISNHAFLDAWFDKDQSLLSFSPPDGGWCIREILEHVMLTSHHLLILIDKGSEKAIRKAEAEDLDRLLEYYRFDIPAMESIGVYRSFPWHRPDHTAPKGQKPLEEIRNELRWQLYVCLCHLDVLRNGEGILHHTTMSVFNLGKLDVYQYIYFLALHARRHLQQIHKNEQRFNHENLNTNEVLI